MNVAIYHPWICLKGGIERTILETKRRSRHDWTIYTSRFDAEGTFPELRSMEVIELQRVSVKRTYSVVLGAAWRILTAKIDLSSHDALFICCDGLGSLLAFRNASRPLVCLCFTPLRAVYDEEYRARYLGSRGKLLPLALLIEAAYRGIDRIAWQRYGHVFCVSRTVRQRVLRGKLCRPERIDIAHPGIPADRIRFCPEADPYFFLPGRIMWTKDVELGIRAFLDFNARHGRRWRLVVAGMVDAKSQEYFQELRRLAGGDESICFVRGPDDHEMDQMYSRCYAALFTAFNEDWGIVPLEAMAHGKPVIAVNRGGPTESIVDGETGLLVDGTVGALSQAMAALASQPELARRLGLGGLARVRQFTWRAFVERIDSYLDALASASRG